MLGGGAGAGAGVGAAERGAFRPRCFAVQGQRAGAGGAMAVGAGTVGTGVTGAPDSATVRSHMLARRAGIGSSASSGDALEGRNFVDGIGLGRALLHAEESGETARARCAASRPPIRARRRSLRRRVAAQGRAGFVRLAALPTRACVRHALRASCGSGRARRRG